MSASHHNPQQRIATFMASPLGTLSDVEAAIAAVIGVPDPWVSGKGGGRADGAGAIREASLAVLQAYTASASRTVVDIESGRRTRLKSPLACVDLGDLVIDEARVGGLASDAAALARRIVAAQGVPVFIGGDRGLFTALLDCVPAHERSAVLLVSHDLRLPAQAASCRVAALGANGLQQKAAWDALSGSGTVIRADQVHDEGVDATAAALRAFFGGHDAIFCLLDMAVLDTGHAAGTADANIGGLTPEQLIGLLAGLDLSARVAGVAMTNVVPWLDRRAQTENVAAQVLVTLLARCLLEALA